MAVEGQALVVLTMTRVGFNEPVVKKHRWLGNKVEQVAGISDVRYFENLQNEGACVVYAISKCVGVNLLELVHTKYAFFFSQKHFIKHVVLEVYIYNTLHSSSGRIHFLCLK